MSKVGLIIEKILTMIPIGEKLLGLIDGDKEESALV
jgi:hypothetical protein